MYMAIVLHALCGYFLGRYLSKVLAVSFAVIGSYGWVAFAWTVEPAQIRYMAGPALALCCTSAGELTPQAPWVLFLFSSFLSSAVFLGLVGLMSDRIRRIKVSLWGSGSCLAVLGIISSFGIGSSLGINPERPMGQDRYHCAGSSPEVCLTDVQLSRIDNREVIESTFAELHRLGMPQMKQVKALPPGSNVLTDGDTAYMVVFPSMQPQDAVHSAATNFSYTADISKCSSNDFESLYISQTIFGAWLDTKAAKVLDSSSAQTLQDNAKNQLSAFEGAQDKLERVLSTDEEQQRAWATETYQHLQNCESVSYPGDN